MRVAASILSVFWAFQAPSAASAGAVDFVMDTVSLVIPPRPINATKVDVRKNQGRGLSKEEIEEENQQRRERNRERRERARKKIAEIQPDVSQLTRLTKEEVNKAVNEDQPWIRHLGWGGSSSQTAVLADSGESYDMWQQAYRMLGGFIDCDHSKSDDDHHSGDEEDREDNESGCSRWMLWAAYVDPNYTGQGYYEYFGDEPAGTLDCHNPDSEWELLGVYRQEFYQFIEQISKHLWAIDDYEYVVALAGLAYMTDADCFYVGADGNGNSIYAGVAPQSEGKFEMALYTDTYCLTPDDSLGMTFDDFGLTSNVQLSSHDEGNGDDDAYSYAQEWWEDSQEYTLTQLNDVYESFKYCTSCVDYPTYQDGYFIGDDGTDDDDLINQCWKFYSHDSFTCEGDCIAMAHAQGTILSVVYGGVSWGQTLSSFYTTSSTSEESSSTPKKVESRWSRMLANVFVTFSFILFVATFLAFAVARRSRHRERASGRSRRLLDGDERSSRRRSRKEGQGDGVFRSKSRGDDDDRKSRKSTRSKSGSKRRSRKEPQTYDPPSSRRSRSQRHLDDF